MFEITTHQTATEIAFVGSISAEMNIIQSTDGRTIKLAELMHHCCQRQYLSSIAFTSCLRFLL